MIEPHGPIVLDRAMPGLYTMNFVIRKASVSDAAAIARVQVASWRSTYPGLVSQSYLDALDAEERSQQWRLRISRGIGIFLVATDDSGIFGFLSGGSIRKPIDGYDAELYAIYLSAEKQGMGAGRELLSQLAKELDSGNYKSLTVWILAENSSRGFYEHLGGTLIARDEVEIGGELLPEVAYGWPSLDALK